MRLCFILVMLLLEIQWWKKSPIPSNGGRSKCRHHRSWERWTESQDLSILRELLFSSQGRISASEDQYAAFQGILFQGILLTHENLPPDLRTYLRCQIIPWKASHSPRNRTGAPGSVDVVSRNMTLIPRGGVQGPRSYVELSGGYVDPRSCLFAPRDRNEAPRCKIAPGAKPSSLWLIEFDPVRFPHIRRWMTVIQESYIQL